MNLRRAYFECRYGQLHVRTAFPSTGGFNERPPMVCFHDLGRSSQSLVNMLPQLGVDRSVYACDLPGFGLSDAPVGVMTIEAHAAAIGDVLANLRLRSIDVLGVGLGAAVALELALSPDSRVRKTVLVQLPFTSKLKRDDPRFRPDENGGHLLNLWEYCGAQGGESNTPAARSEALAEELKSLSSTDQAIEALGRWDALERLNALRRPAILLQSRGTVPDALGSASALPLTIDERLPDGAGLSALSPTSLGEILRSFLDT